MIFNNETLRYHHGHDHDHDHEHTHEHVHTHGESAENKDEKTLKILLVHWINHNESHEEGFKEWVEKAKAIGKNDTADYIEKAIECMQQANQMLMEAKKYM